MPYSVSPRRKLKIVGLKPSWNFSTRMPTRLAARKCPSSCTNTRTPRTKPNERRVINVPDTNRTSDLQLYSVGNRLCTVPGGAIDLSDRVNRCHIRWLMRVHRFLDDMCNRGK